MSDAIVVLRLYVAGDAQNSQRAIANLTTFCSQFAEASYAIEIVDVLTDPERALQDGVFLTPTLTVDQPFSTSTIVGDLSDTPLLRKVIGLDEGSK